MGYGTLAFGSVSVHGHPAKSQTKADSWIISQEPINFNCLNIRSNLHNWVTEVIKCQSDVLVPEMIDIDGEVSCMQFLDDIGQLHGEEIADYNNGAPGYGHCVCILLDFVH
ncbi:hypothetical protein TorRG33x02_310950 [Trema orientale]|uniref:Uncharacterized protein n=1 Tax=Trema orientale TaxID=63057 RepID=A0A2P5BS53_TREOI|nr:hypothetical protein TorRG33x02_310950 [Trema orientale]